MYTQPLMSPAIAHGLQVRRPNKKRKARLPYHAKKHLSLSVVGKQVCQHSLGKHEDINWPYIGDDGQRRQRLQTMSFALPCQVAHKATTKNPTHKDTMGRKWK